jgi:hypothetical protein
MIYLNNDHKPCLYIIGGSKLVPGGSEFEIYNVNLEKNQWSSLTIQKNIIQPFGTRPEIVVDPKTKEVHWYMFSGITPSQRMNQGIKICSPDLLHFKLSKMAWKRLK